MDQVLKNIEENIGFKLPLEIRAIYEKLNDNYFVFDTRKAGGHWLLNADYFLIKPGDLNTKERGEFFIKDFYVCDGVNILERLNQKVSKSIKEHWSENKVFAFAWSNDVVEKDASLVYVFDNDGAVKGIYAHSLNYVEDKVFVAKRLSDIFILDEIYIESSRKAKFAIKGDKAMTSYNEILNGDYKVIDVESVDDVKDYEHIIEIFSNLSVGKFTPMIKSLREWGGIRSIDLEIDGEIYSTELQGGNGCVDLKIIDFVNDCLIDKGHTRKKFIAFSDVPFGQEISVAFVSKSILKTLRKLKSLVILKD
ncbi:hypothetical protein [Persicobacter diffluens]|uniref:Uncharacterized protein n=1 Tax=Persicobacter diffluens TaxID=981 RepID=A0AAN4W0W4_9BACT|nr:hypothetical protein PEDI_36190 [Persicobacter diffluens]